MLLSRSLRRKIVATLVASAAISLLYQATVIDSRSVPAAAYGQSAPDTSGRLPFVATAYCKGQTTASGVAVRSGIAAADPRLLPVGSVVRLDGVPEGHEGIYTVLDTGPKVQGRHVDLYMWSCHEALAFGRRKVSLTVIRRGWYPNDAPAGLPPKGD
jgi:3D (Asp-Asp-Asp) domain-containing protein